MSLNYQQISTDAYQTGTFTKHKSDRPTAFTYQMFVERINVVLDGRLELLRGNQQPQTEQSPRCSDDEQKNPGMASEHNEQRNEISRHSICKNQQFALRKMPSEKQTADISGLIVSLSTLAAIKSATSRHTRHGF
jgi:hypothetical protein